MLKKTGHNEFTGEFEYWVSDTPECPECGAKDELKLLNTWDESVLDRYQDWMCDNGHVWTRKHEKYVSLSADPDLSRPTDD